MAIKTYSLKADGSKQLSKNFAAKEFACKDGTDKFLVDDALVTLLQQIRDHFGVAIVINSAYRTAAHNKAVGGSPNSQHLLGRAADIVVKGVEPLTVARYAETLGAGGIGHYPAGQGNFCHIDTRAGKSRWKKENGKEVSVAGFLPPKEDDKNMAAVESKKMTVNGQPVQVRGILEKGENFVHLRDLVAAMGGRVIYNSVTKEIRVDSGR